ncbi:MAG: polyketide cyclase [Rikenellaceae bacterium]|jgi:carbon monoxide dehydrogenase subunit G|nr:polyketide cyclase [Rikenellaceae bacterium]
MSLEKYVSKQVRINRPDSMVYALLSDFSRFIAPLQDKVEDFTVDGDRCSFTVKGMKFSIRMVEKIPYTTIKFMGDEGSPFEFVFWIQLHRVDAYDTRMRLTLHVNLNMMMKMMLGKKLQEGIDQIADHIATAFNMTPDEARRMAESAGWTAPENFPWGDDQPTSTSASELSSADFAWPMPDPDKPVS